VTRKSKGRRERKQISGKKKKSSHEKVRWKAERREKSAIKMGTIGEGDKDNDGGGISVAKLLQGSSSRRAYFVLWQLGVSSRGQ
jgi:hypothetical protein